MSRNSIAAAVAAVTLFAAGSALAAASNGPEPYSAPTPTYKAMTKEPLVKAQQPSSVVSLGSDSDIQGPAAGPEPYSAPTPNYPPMTKEPLLPPPAKTAPPKL